MSSALVFLQDIALFDNLASIRKFTEAAGSLDGGPFYTILRKTPDEQLAKLFNTLLRILHRCIRFPICCSCDPRGFRASTLANLLNYVVINSEDHGSPNHTDTKMTRLFAILLRTYIPIYRPRVIRNAHLYFEISV
jgi:hypothetical protein